MKVILSTSLILEDGIFRSRSLTLEEAQAWVAENNPQNFCGHSTVKVLGLEPAASREQCRGYTAALCLSAKGRLEFGREYSVEEILAIGVDFRLVEEVGDQIVKAANHLHDAAWSCGNENYPGYLTETASSFLRWAGGEE